MVIDRFEDIEAWQLARDLTCKVYALTADGRFSKDFGLKGQIQNAAGSSMHNTAEGFDAESNAEFMRFLRYSKRSCTEVQSQLYVALDNKYISQAQFDDVYEQARRTRAASRGFINYLMAHGGSSKKSVKEGHQEYGSGNSEESINREPLNLEPLNPEPINS
jgi:four helix bundle protein